MIITRYDLINAGVKELQVQSIVTRAATKFAIRTYDDFALTADGKDKRLTKHFDLDELIEKQTKYIDKVLTIHKVGNEKLLITLIDIRKKIKLKQKAKNGQENTKRTK